MSLALSRHSGESLFLHLAPGADVEKLLMGVDRCQRRRRLAPGIAGLSRPPTFVHGCEARLWIAGVNK